MRRLGFALTLSAPLALAGCLAAPGAPRTGAGSGDKDYFQITTGGGTSGGGSLTVGSDDRWSDWTIGRIARGSRERRGRFAPGSYARGRALLEAQVPALARKTPPCRPDVGVEAVLFAPPIDGRDAVADCAGGQVAPLIAALKAEIGG